MLIRPVAPNPSEESTRSVASPQAVRRGSSFIEIQVAFVVLGLTLGAVGPMTVSQLRQATRIEKRFSNDSVYYVARPSTPWASKLGAAASIGTADPGSPSPLPSSTINDLTINDLNTDITSETLSAEIEVTEHVD